MKKVFFVFLIAAAVNVYSFDFMGQVYGGFNFMSVNTNLEDKTVFGGLNSGKGLIEMSGEYQKFGGWLRLGYEFGQEFFGDFDIWWKQSDVFQFYITYNDDGHFALDYIAGWNYFGFPGDVLGLQGCAGSRAFYDGFTRGTFIRIAPIELFEFHLGLNMFESMIAEYMFKSLTFQMVFNLPSSSRIGFTYEGDYMTEPSLDDNPVLSIYYHLAIKENAVIDFGASYRFWESRTTNDVTVTRYHPLNLGVGATFNVKKVGLKTRFSTSFLGWDKVESTGITENQRPFEIGFDILPSYSFKEKINGYLNAGLGFAFPDDGENDVLWRVNPYIVIGDEEFAAFYGGLALHNTAIEKRALHFTFSLGLSITLRSGNLPKISWRKSDDPSESTL